MKQYTVYFSEPVAHTYKEERFNKETRECLSGQAGLLTISKAFCWGTTEEGFDFWKEVDEKFTDWFEDMED